MTDTEPPRAPPPSRYKTVRRKPAAPSTVPAPLPQQPEQRKAPQQPAAVAPRNVTKSPSRIEQPRGLIDQASHPKGGIPTEVPQSRFRKLLRLNTSAREDPAVVHERHPATAVQPREHHTLTKTPQRSKTYDNYNPHMQRPARVDAFLALEGKKPPPKDAVEKTKPQPKKEYDFHVPLYFDKKGPVDTATMKNATTEELLEQVRPGHERYLLECWPSLGVVRPIRYFENIKDVLASWDQGNSTHLRVTKKLWGGPDRRLTQFPNVAPPSGECDMHYYNLVDKKWTKRTVNIDSGSIRIVKTGRPHEKDYMVHISMDNFDIYTFDDTFKPDKKIRAPTSYCFALKSQHQQSIFGKNSVFVHYLAADNEATFTAWYKLIRDLKTRLNAEKKGLAWWVPADPTPPRTSSDSPRGRPFQPLIARDPAPIPDVPRSKSLHRSKTTRTASSRNRSASGTNPPPGLVGTLHSEVFSPGGLLGSEYEDKRALALKAWKEERNAANAWATSTRRDRDLSPRNQDVTSPTADSYHSSRPGTSHKPSPGSTTLLSFNETELPRSRRKNTLPDSSSSGLVAHAGHVDELPTSPLLRRPTTSTSRRHEIEDSHHGGTGFTGTGLLAGHHNWVGSVGQGHGVKLGSDAVGRNGDITPLMDMREESMFAKGSLLEKREREKGRVAPLMERDGGGSGSD